MKTKMIELTMESNGVWTKSKEVKRRISSENIKEVLENLIIPSLLEFGYYEDHIYEAMHDIGEENSESF